MKKYLLPLALLATFTPPASMASNEPPATCKPVKYFGVSGCELLPDHTCPPGYHKQIVDPPDPRMKAPSRLMCVPDKPASEKPPAKQPPQPKPEARPDL